MKLLNGWHGWYCEWMERLRHCQFSNIFQHCSISGCFCSNWKNNNNWAKRCFCWLTHSLALMLLKKELAEWHVVTIMAVMHWCGSLNTISSPAPWIRPVKRFGCDILSSTREEKKKKSGATTMGYFYVIRLLQSYIYTDTFAQMSRYCCNKSPVIKSQERWCARLITCFSQVLRLRKLSTIVSALSHCRLQLTELSIAAPDLLPHPFH